MEDSPAYRLNHEEIIKAFEEGISFIEGLEPQEAIADARGHLPGVRFRRSGEGDVVELPARSRLVAAGTTNRETARRLLISEATVKTHLLHLYEKLGVNDRAAAVSEAYQRGLLS